MRGTKLTSWQIPPIWMALRENNFVAPEGSIVPKKQLKMFKATNEVLEAIAEDVRLGLLETVGIKSALSIDGGKCSVVLELAPETDIQLIATAIDAENVEAWMNNNRVNIALNPWYSTKDVDQTVLCTIKVIHVLLGIHASDSAPPPTFKQKLFSGIKEIIEIQKTAKK